MILSFKNQFIEKIKAGTKNQTIRDDKAGRWHVGRKIEFWKGNPRNTKQYPYQFGAGVCTKIYDILLDFNDDYIRIDNEVGTRGWVDITSLNQFAVSDGFADYKEMKDFFIKEYSDKLFKGKLIIFDINTTFGVSDDQNTVMCYGTKYIAIIDKSDDLACGKCDLDKKYVCRFTPCFAPDRKDGQLDVYFKKQ